jgi:peptidoglycan/xylan/chitin deacetylase (PgdA/CDA1 family)
MTTMGIPVLMYHEVGPRETLTERYTVPTDNFRAQLRYLRDNGYTTISLRDYLAQARVGVSAARMPVILTFDDNNLSHYLVSTPLLVEFGLTATFFIVSGFIDTRPEFLTSGQLREMERCGMSVESHSHTHRFLSELADEELRAELETSKRVLEEHLHHPIEFISCPGGRYSGRVLEFALAAGYHGVCTSAPGLNAPSGGDASRLIRRFLVSAGTPLETFARMVRGERRFVRRQIRRYRMKSAVKHVLGERLYHDIWQRWRRDL